MNWDWQYVREMLPQLMVGVWYSLLVTIASSFIALVGGLLLAILESVSTTFGRVFVRFWLEVFRGVPVLVFLYFGFYVLPEIGINLPALPIGIAVLGIVYAAFCSEVYRGSLMTIPSELRDACVALSLSRYVTWKRVLIPLMIKRSVPALINYILALLRLTAWLFAIGAPVLMYQADLVAEQSYRYLEPYTITGLIYMALNLPFIYILSRLKEKNAQC